MKMTAIELLESTAAVRIVDSDAKNIETCLTTKCCDS